MSPTVQFIRNGRVVTESRPERKAACWHLSRRAVTLDGEECEVCECGNIFEVEEYDRGPTLRDTGETVAGFAEMTPEQRRRWFHEREAH